MTIMRTSDGDLVRQILAGDQEAFAGLVDRYRGVVCGVAYHHLGNFEDAQDAAQEAFVHAYLRLSQLRDPEKFAPWLRRITTRACADHLRRRGETWISWEDGAECAMAPAAPDRDLEQFATRFMVRAALQRLSEKTRLTVTLAYMGGYSHAEIAEFLEIPVNTVRSRLQHAKLQLREEMFTMVTDAFSEGKPDPRFTRRVVEEALRRGDEAYQMNAAGDAIRAYDEALRALDRLEPAAERQRLQMEALWKKATAVELPRGSRAAVKLYDQSLAVAEELGDRKTQADKLMFLGTWRKRRQGGAECDRRALQLYQELGNARGQGETLLLMSSRSLCEGDTVTARAYCEQALPFLEAAEDGIWAAWCRAQLNLLTEVGEEQFPRLTTWRALCDGLEQRGGAVSSLFQRGVRSVAPLSPARSEVPDALLLYGVFAQLGDVKPFLDASAAVGGSWSSDAFSYSYQPLRATVTIQSASERVMVPAGTFDNCLLTEQVTIEGDRPDKAGKRSRQLNREYQCGTRRAWYAPGVGLVQLHVQTTGGKEALIRLQEYTVDDAGDGYLPLSMGNCWSYCWGNMPEEYVTKEAYRVAEREGELWYLEHFGYAFKA